MTKHNTPDALQKVVRIVRSNGYPAHTHFDESGDPGIIIHGTGRGHGRYGIIAEGDRGYFWRNDAGTLSDGFTCDLYLSDGEEIAEALLNLLEEG